MSGHPGEMLGGPPLGPARQHRRIRTLPLTMLALALLTCALIVLFLVMNSAVKGSAKSPTVALTRDLFMACANFRQLKGQYPWPKPDSPAAGAGIKAQDVYAELAGLPGAKFNTQGAVCYKGGEHALSGGALVDRWGHEIMFRVDPKSLGPVIWSCGPNGKDDTNDGSSSDPAKLPKTYYCFGDGDDGDDIVIRP